MPAPGKSIVPEIIQAPAAVQTEEVTVNKLQNNVIQAKTSQKQQQSVTPSIRDALNNIGKKANPSVLSDVPESDYSMSDSPVDQDAFTEEELMHYFSEYIEGIKTEEPRMYSALKNQILAVDDVFTVEMKFSNNAQIEDFKQKIKFPLQNYLREKLKNNSIEITEKLSKTENEAASKFLTDADKLKHFIEKNSSMQKFRQEFNLDFD